MRLVWRPVVAAVALVALGLACAESGEDLNAPPVADTLFADGFESNTLNAWDDDFHPETKSIVTNAAAAHSGSRYLEVTYDAGEDGGALTKFLMNPGQSRMYARMYVKFPNGWAGDTKLLLLRGSRSDDQWSSFGVAGDCPNGTNWFVSNVIVRGSALPLRFYSYYVGMSREGDGVTCWGRHGTTEDPGGTASPPPAAYFTPLEVSKGTWHLLEFEVILNTPAQANGEQRVWLDGALRGQWVGLRWRTDAILELNAVTLEFSATTIGQARTLQIDDVLVAGARP